MKMETKYYLMMGPNIVIVKYNGEIEEDIVVPNDVFVFSL